MLREMKFVAILPVLLKQAFCITNNKANTDLGNPIKFIWDLTSYAVQSRQFENNYFPHGSGYPLMNQNALEAMFSIAQNDDHLCVPKLLCEITAGTMNYGRQSFLPIEFNMNTVLDILSTFQGISPVALFGRAALLGYNSKGDSYSCARAYPRCPNDPDLLLNYLNNHNGGFFRFFNGLPNKDIQKPSDEIVGFDGQHYGFLGSAQKRILNQPNNHKQGRKLVFPAYQNEGIFLDYQKPSPNHVPSQTIFPIRTGTGSLTFEDPEYINSNYYDRSRDFIKFE